MRNETIEKLRVFAILIVVVGHSIIIYDSSWGIYSTNNQNQFFYIMKQFINIIQMPLFIIISGFLYSNTCRKYTLKSIIIKKAKRIIIPFLLVAIIWMVPLRLIAEYQPFVEKGYIKSLISVIIGIDSGHLWYLPTLYALFIIIYIANKVVESKGKIAEVIIFIIFLICYGIAGKTTSILFISNILRNLIYFYIGFLISKKQKEPEFRFDLLIIYIVLSVIIVFCIEQTYIKQVLNFITAVTGFYALYGVFEKTKINKYTKVLDRNSFAIYLLHSPLLYIIYNNLADINSYLLVAINISIGVVVPIIIAFILRKLKLNFIIGES